MKFSFFPLSSIRLAVFGLEITAQDKKKFIICFVFLPVFFAIKNIMPFFIYLHLFGAKKNRFSGECLALFRLFELV